ncbi:DNA polymerase, gamma and tau subunits [Prochlorococcus marinus str. MIT 9515]|uniref:DNA polymerase III subunit gamma/tau n=1 Tax=Prochlorococcus marinus (strain MIT 9515) TaxID=167542 RepID=A2BZ44_PROM5|nr:DNA polymerase III subunit gamma/tau [Prochlorococcus marinus]ABM73055.1 DNA polymerase, gamma and tau subunits [Prochlorococcus marinus str. MIT 9515]
MLNIHKPFHQKYRPSNLDELVGQEFISITLKQALISKKIAPAYLFNGPRGTGKTSSARIFAKSLNCLSCEQPTANPCGKCELCKQIADGNALDIIEIDAASNTGVDNIREIIDGARFTPTQARWKVYVIDECHMLSTAASNALLKTIEEPPERVVFILATTNPERVINTIQSRCQKFDFKRISSNTIFHNLSEIANKESIKFEDQALKLIAKRSNGGMRDAQSLLDQLSLLPNGVTTKNVQNLLGEVSENDLINLINALIYNEPESLLISCNQLYDSGNEPHEILVGLLNITRDLLLKTLNNNYSDIFYTSIDFQNELNKFSKNISKMRIIDWHNKLKNIDYQIKTSDNPKLWLEVHLTSLIENKIEDNIVNNGQSNKETLNQKVINKDELINKTIISKNANQTESEDINKKELINNQDIQPNYENANQTESEDINKKELINNQDIQPNYEHANQTDFLKEKWELILSKLELPSTRMLLSQQAELASIDSNEVLIALSPNWENMIKSRKIIIENAVKKVCGDKVKLNFSSKKININNTAKSQEKIIKKSTSNREIQNTNFQNSNTPIEKPQKEFYDDNSKNLANFFNGEIIDLDE